MLKIQCYHCSGSYRCYGKGLILGPGIPSCQGQSPKHVKIFKSKIKKYIYIHWCWFHYYLQVFSLQVFSITSISITSIFLYFHYKYFLSTSSSLPIARPHPEFSHPNNCCMTHTISSWKRTQSLSVNPISIRLGHWLASANVMGPKWHVWSNLMALPFLISLWHKNYGVQGAKLPFLGRRVKT